MSDAATFAELEHRGAERTAELEVAVSNLNAQMSRRAQAEVALRESEERYRRLVEQSPDAVLVIAPGELLYVNAAGARLFGARDAAELMAVPPLNLVHPSECAATAAQMQRLATLGGTVAQTEARLVRLDGTLIDAEITSAGVKRKYLRALPAGRRLRFSGPGRDRTWPGNLPRHRPTAPGSVVGREHARQRQYLLRRAALRRLKASRGF